MSWSGFKILPKVGGEAWKRPYLTLSWKNRGSSSPKPHEGQNIFIGYNLFAKLFLSFAYVCGESLYPDNIQGWF